MEQGFNNQDNNYQQGWQSMQFQNQDSNQQDNNSQKPNNKQKRLMILGVAILVVLLVGVTYAFFNYTRTGTANTIRVGRIAFNSNQTETISLTNVFPISSTQAATDTTNTDEAVITITGDTTYPNGVEYLITATDVSNTVGSGASAKTVPIAIEVTASNGLGTSNADYFTNRGSTTSIYKVLSDGTVTDDGKLVVGYIAAGQTGINGTVTIKAYLDSASIAISDTYDESDPGTNYNGTTSEWVGTRTVLTTTEWNSLQTNGVSFKVKVEANEGIWVTTGEESLPENALYSVLENQNPQLDNINSTYVQNISTEDSNTKVTFLDNVEGQGKVIRLSAGIDFAYASSDTNGKGLYIRGGTENDTYPIYYYRGAVENNNVAFAGFCWQIVRTTETGGMKLIYNGLQDGNGACTPLTAETSGEISTEGSSEVSGGIEEIVRRSGVQTSIEVYDENQFSFADEDIDDSPANVGYMYGTVYEFQIGYWANNIYYGDGYTYNNGEYSLTNPTITTPNATYRYSCNSANANATCSEMRYIFYYESDNIHLDYNKMFYLSLTGGDSIGSAMEKMQTNTNDSNAKQIVDSWYATNMTTYTNKLEDTIWCNNRKTLDNLEEWYDSLNFSTDANLWDDETDKLTTPSLECLQPNDRFTVSNSNGNGALTYPVGLLTLDEMRLAGIAAENSSSYIVSGKGVWTMTPASISRDSSIMFYVNNIGILSYYNTFTYLTIRPAVSLKHNVTIVDNGADGTLEHPYVVE